MSHAHLPAIAWRPYELDRGMPVEGTQEVLALLRHTQAHGGIDAVQELIINGERK